VVVGVAQNYFGNNSWPVIVEIDLKDGSMLNFVSINKNNRTDLHDPEVDPIVTTILN